MERNITLTKQILYKVLQYIEPGKNTQEVDSYARSLMSKYKVKPAFYGYMNYPANICISVNHEILHGLPKISTIIKEGDVVSVDLGIIKNNLYTDMAETIIVGKSTEIKRKLLNTGIIALVRALEQCKAGNTIGDISNAIQTYVESQGMNVIRNYYGHGIGRNLHEWPQIPNYGMKNTGPKLQKGMILAIEVMVTLGKPDVIIEEDGWTVSSKDKALTAHFEDMVIIT